MSVTSQSYTNLEIIVTDDSGGSLRHIVDRVADPRIHYLINPEPLGLTSNHCRGIDASTGPYVAIMHDDDRWHPAYIEESVAVLDRDHAIGYVMSGADEFSVDGVVRRRRPTTMRPGLQQDPLEHLLTYDFRMAVPSLTVWRRDALNCAPRPWPTKITGDMVAFVEPVVHGWKVYYNDTTLVRYRVHEGQAGAQRQFEHRDGLVDIWSRMRFSTTRHERLRRRLLADCLVARAGSQLRRGNRREARVDVVEATRQSPLTAVPRKLAIASLSCSAVATQIAARRPRALTHD